MSKIDTGRLEAFSDGVLAIIITIMVLELKVPHGTEFKTLLPLLPVFLSYILSFIYIGIYWNNHHHLLLATDHVNGKILWANSHLLFWLSLIPFTTGWMGENHFENAPVALYGINLFAAAVGYIILQKAILAENKNTALSKALGHDNKGTTSALLYLAAIGISFYSQWIPQILYVTVAFIWLIPERRIEKEVTKLH